MRGSLDERNDSRFGTRGLRVGGRATEKNERESEEALHILRRLPRSVDLLKRDQVQRGGPAWCPGKLDRRQILEHEVPFPSLGGVRGL
jgi:hypothetical protein